MKSNTHYGDSFAVEELLIELESCIAGIRAELFVGDFAEAENECNCLLDKSKILHQLVRLILIRSEISIEKHNESDINKFISIEKTCQEIAADVFQVVAELEECSSDHDTTVTNEFCLSFLTAENEKLISKDVQLNVDQGVIQLTLKEDKINSDPIFKQLAYSTFPTLWKDDILSIDKINLEIQTKVTQTYLVNDHT